jgi:hypothetical protein
LSKFYNVISLIPDITMQKQLQYRHHSKSLAANLVSAIKIFFPALAVFWLFFYSYAKAVPTTKLRGSQSFEVPMPPPGDKSQTLMRKSTEVRRKIIVPHHAIIVAGHAVVRLNKMTTAGKSSELSLYRNAKRAFMHRLCFTL